MKKILFLAMLMLWVNCVHSQWQTLTTASGFAATSCSFPNSLTGYISGYGGNFQKTTNGGLNWINLAFPTTQHNMESVFFVSPDTGWLTSTSDTLYYTTDGAQSWARKTLVPALGTKIFFINSLTGWSGGAGTIKKTTNGGINWINCAGISNGDIHFLNENIGWTVEYLGAGISRLLKSTNGGLTWNALYTVADFRNLYCLKFIDENTGWVGGYREYIAKTTDGGLNWVVQSNSEGSSNAAFSMDFINANTGWIGGENGSVFYTTNGGSNWIPQQYANIGRIHDVQFVNNTATGYMAGQFGSILKTVNGGGLTSITQTSETPKGFALKQNFPNPFNPSTSISYQLAVTGKVTLRIYDVMGRMVNELVNEKQNPGAYQLSFDGSELTSGVYYYTLKANELSETRKMLLVK